MHKYYDFLNSEDATQRSLYTGQDHHRLKMTPKPKPEQPPQPHPNYIGACLFVPAKLGASMMEKALCTDVELVCVQTSKVFMQDLGFEV